MIPHVFIKLLEDGRYLHAKTVGKNNTIAVARSDKAEGKYWTLVDTGKGFAVIGEFDTWAEAYEGAKKGIAMTCDTEDKEFYENGVGHPEGCSCGCHE